MLFALTAKGIIHSLKESDATPEGTVAFCRNGFPYWILGREFSVDDENAKPYRPNVLEKPEDVLGFIKKKAEKGNSQMLPIFDDSQSQTGPYGHEESE